MVAATRKAATAKPSLGRSEGFYMAEAAVAMYRSLDEMPGVAEERQQVREKAQSLLFRRFTQAQMDSVNLPLAIDALSTADHVIRARNQYGEASAEHTERLNGLRLDCHRLVAEWYRKKRPEYFPPLRHSYNATTGEYYSHGLSIRQMTEQALRPIPNNVEEEARRVNEKVEDETPRILRGIGSVALSGVGIRTISECTDKAITEYKADMASGAPHRGYDGYVPEIEKLMVRDIRVDEETGDRWQEQVALPGMYITHEIIQLALKRRGIDAEHMDKTALHGTQLLVEDDLLEFVQLLDDVASEEQGVNLFMGEEVEAGYVKDYAGFRREALTRQKSLINLADTVANFVLDLAEAGFDRRRAPAHVEEFVKKLLLDMARKDLSKAEQMFDVRTFTGLVQVNQLYAQGRDQEAFTLLQTVEAQAPGGGFCSGGSCGLERVDLSSTFGQDMKVKLRAEQGDTIVKDRERKCRCGARGIVYAYNKSKVNKYCTECGAYESKQTTGKTE